MQLIRLGETTAALIEIPFTSVLATNLQSRILGSTLANSSIAVKIKKGGVATAVSGGAGTFTATDDANAPGVRGYRPATTEIVTGVSTFIFTGTNMEPREVPVMVIPEDPYKPAYYGTVIAGTLTTALFTTSLAQSDANHWVNNLIEFLTGANAGSVLPIGAYTSTGGTVALKTGYALPNTPTIGDVFRVITN